MNIKTYPFYFFIIFFNSCVTTLLHSQPAGDQLKPSDKEIIFMLLNAQMEREKTLDVFFIKALEAAAKGHEVKVDIHNHNNNRNSTETLVQTTTSSVMKNAYDYAKEKLPQAYESISTHKTKLIASTILASYISLLAYINYQYYIVYAQQSWAYWADHLTLAELISANLDVLLEKLIQDIHIKYLNKENVHDIIQPHAKFIQEIDTQIDAAYYYIYAYQILNSCYIASLFGLRQTTYEKIKDTHTKLLFIKNMFISWVSKQNIPIFKS